MKIILAIEDNAFMDAFEKMLNQFMWTEFATIRIVHVITPVDITLTWPTDECRSEAEALVAMLANRLRLRFSGAKVEELVLEGHANEAIIDCAIDWNADLIVTGSHSKLGVNRFLLGSTASSIASQAPCSVLIVRPEHAVTERISEDDTIATAIA